MEKFNLKNLKKIEILKLIFLSNYYFEELPTTQESLLERLFI